MNVPRRVFLAAAVGLSLAATMGPVSASEDPIPGVDVVVEKIPPGHAFFARTDRQGYISYRSLTAGNYFISDRNGNKASVKHPGGPVKWRLVGTRTDKGLIWTLVDESDPL